MQEVIKGAFAALMHSLQQLGLNIIVHLPKLFAPLLETLCQSTTESDDLKKPKPKPQNTP
jgi:hypothetical protein